MAKSHGAPWKYPHGPDLTCWQNDIINNLKALRIMLLSIGIKYFKALCERISSRSSLNSRWQNYIIKY